MQSLPFQVITEPGVCIALSNNEAGSLLNRDDYTDPEVITHRRSFLASFGLPLEQVVRVNVQYDDSYTYTAYREVGVRDYGSGAFDNEAPVSDALVTTDPQVILFLPLADCVGAILYDPLQHVLMMTHLGRHSLEVDGGVSSVRYLQDHYASDPASLRVWLTPAPSKEAYAIWKLDGAGMKESAIEQLLRAGIRTEHITNHPSETDHDPSFYSHSEYLAGRRSEDGRYGLFAWLTNEPPRDTS